MPFCFSFKFILYFKHDFLGLLVRSYGLIVKKATRSLRICRKLKNFHSTFLTSTSELTERIWLTSWTQNLKYILTNILLAIIFAHLGRCFSTTMNKVPWINFTYTDCNNEKSTTIHICETNPHFLLFVVVEKNLRKSNNNSDLDIC